MRYLMLQVLALYDAGSVRAEVSCGGGIDIAPEGVTEILFNGFR